MGSTTCMIHFVLSSQWIYTLKQIRVLICIGIYTVNNNTLIAVHTHAVLCIYIYTFVQTVQRFADIIDR